MNKKQTIKIPTSIDLSDLEGEYTLEEAEKVIDAINQRMLHGFNELHKEEEISKVLDKLISHQFNKKETIDSIMALIDKSLTIEAPKKQAPIITSIKPEKKEKDTLFEDVLKLSKEGHKLEYILHLLGIDSSIYNRSLSTAQRKEIRQYKKPVVFYLDKYIDDIFNSVANGENIGDALSKYGISTCTFSLNTTKKQKNKLKYLKYVGSAIKNADIFDVVKINKSDFFDTEKTRRKYITEVTDLHFLDVLKLVSKGMLTIDAINSVGLNKAKFYAHLSKSQRKQLNIAQIRRNR